MKKRWILLIQSGKSVIVKHPINTDAGLLQMLRDLILLYPDAQLITIRLTRDDQLWVRDGHEMVTEAALLGKQLEELNKAEGRG